MHPRDPVSSSRPTHEFGGHHMVDVTRNGALRAADPAKFLEAIARTKIGRSREGGSGAGGAASGRPHHRQTEEREGRSFSFGCLQTPKTPLMDTALESKNRHKSCSMDPALE